MQAQWVEAIEDGTDKIEKNSEVLMKSSIFDIHLF